ncbi:MAG: ThuA domain-containing protein [Planctomycetota bacterium]
MKNESRIVVRTFAALAAATVLSISSGAGDISPEAIEKIEQALPKEAPVKPKKERRLLVYTRCEGFVHGSIPYCAEAFVRMGKATDAYSATVSDDPRVFAAEKLAEFDAIVLDNTTGTLLAEAERRESLLAFVKGGKGLAGVHAATDCSYDWPEFGEMIGGYFDGHPWNEQVTIRVEDPGHPINAAFLGRAFAVADEIYQFRSPYSRESLRVLLSLDVNKTDLAKDGIHREDRDFAVSWVRSYGEGRVFYCSLGHRNEIFWNPTLLRHYLAGLQFVLGDLPADTAPSGVLAAASGTPAPPADDWAAAAAYEPGASRLPLAAIENEVRRALDDPAQRGEAVERLLRLLRDEHSTPAGRAFACRQLSVLGGEECVPDLAPLLRDPHLSHLARFALQRISAPAAGAALRDALLDVEGDLLLGVLDSLGARRDGPAAAIVGAKLPEMTGDARAAAIEMLGRSGTVEAAQALEVAFSASPPETEERGRLSDAILQCARLLGAEGEPMRACALYDLIRASEPPRHVRLAALGGMAVLRPADAVGEVVALLGNPDPRIQGGAAQVIRDVPGEDATRVFAAALGTVQGEACVRLLGALAERGDPAAAPAVTALLESDDPALAAAAVAALGAIGDAASAAPLAALAAAGVDEARRSLAARRGDEIDAALAGLLAGSEPAVQIEVARALGAHQARPQAGTLLGLLARTDDPAVRAAAFAALGGAAGREHLFTLVQLLGRAVDPAEIAAGIDAVVTVCRRDEDVEGRLQPILFALERLAGPGRAPLVRALGRLGGESALAAVQSALAAGGETAAAAAEALAGWPDAAAAEELLGIAREAADPAHRAAAFAGFARTAALASARPAEATVALYRAAFALAATDEMRRSALEGVARVPDLGALDLAAAQLANPAVRRDAARAMIAVAGTLGREHYDAARGAVERAYAACSEDEAVRREAGAVLDRLESSADYITAWLFAGPYTQPEAGGGALLDVAFPPEPAGPAGAIEWKEVPAAAIVAPGYVDLLQIAAGSDCCGYLATGIVSGQAQPARLELGSDDGIEVWLNGEVVHANNVMRGLTLGADVVPVSLKQGDNALLLKITQGGGDWSAACRIRSPEGFHLADVTVRLPQ